MKILTSRNTDVLFDIYRYRYMTTEQVRSLHFAHLDSDSEAPRMLLYRLLRSGVLSKAATYAQSQTSSDGLTVTKPRPVWYLSKGNLTRIIKCKPSASEQFQNIRQPSHLLSDQSLPHEVGLTSIVMAFEKVATKRPDIIDLNFVRTSPRHPMTSAKVQVGSGTQTINPDALVFFRKTTDTAAHPYFFYIEYERGTATAKRYLKEKINPYAAYFNAAKRKYPVSARAFVEVAREFNSAHHLNLKHPDRLLFRVLTVTSTSTRRDGLRTLVTENHPQGVFLFADLDAFCADPFATIWHTKNSVSAIP